MIPTNIQISRIKVKGQVYSHMLHNEGGISVLQTSLVFFGEDVSS